MIESKIEIAAPPATVRQVLLDFDKYPAWHTGFINLLQPEDSAKSLVTLQAGDKVKCDIDGMKFTAEIKENSDELFQWQGPPVMGLIAGLHGFHMKPTESGGTSFTQSEEFSGLIAFTMHPSLLGRLMVGKFAQFNKDLKARAEKLQETQETS